jgi:hypothetical protein
MFANPWVIRPGVEERSVKFPGLSALADLTSGCVWENAARSGWALT